MPFRHRRIPRRRALALLAAGIAACSDSTGSGGGPPRPAAVEVVSGGGQSQTVGQALPQPVTVRVTDSRGRALAGQTVRFAVISGGGSVSPGEQATGSDGLASATWTLGTSVGGEQRLEARVLTGAGAVAASAAVTAVATAGAPAAIAAAGNTTPAGAAGTVLADSLAVQVEDAFHNPVPGVAVQWTVPRGGGSVSPPSTSTDAAGRAKTAWTLGPRVDSAQVVRASIAGVAAPVEFTVTPTLPAGATLVKVSGDSQSALRSTPLPAPLVVAVRDAAGHPLAGVEVTWTTATGILAPPSARTDAQGLAQTTWTLGATGGPETATATAAGVGSATFQATSLRALSVVIRAPAPGATIVADSLRVEAAASGDLPIQSVTATVDGRTVTLAPVSGVYRGALPLAGLAPGAKTLAVRATDTGGQTAPASVAFTYAVAPADLRLVRWTPVTAPNLVVEATCGDCVSLEVRLGSVRLATGTTSISRTIDLSAYAQGLTQPTLYPAYVIGTSASGGKDSIRTGVAAYKAAPVEDLLSTGATRLFDASAQRLLYAVGRTDLWIRHRVTGDPRKIATLDGGADFPRTARLTPLGAIWSQANGGAESRVREWRNETLIDLGPAEGSRFALAVELPWAAWGTGNRVIREDLRTGAQQVVATDRLAETNALLRPGEVDVAPNGDVVYTNAASRVVRVRDGVPAVLSPAGSACRYPKTDGLQVIFYCYGADGGKLYRVGSGGETAVLATSASTFAQLVQQSYEVNNGWAAYFGSVRSPSGQVRQTPPGMLLESLGPDGHVVVGNRYLSRADGTLAQLPTSEAYASTFWRGTTGYLVLLGGELLRIVP